MEMAERALDHARSNPYTARMRISTFRLYLLRAMYLMISLFVMSQFWPLLFNHKPWSLMHGVAVSMFAAMGPLALLGLRYPLKMLPVLLFELTWKSLWLVAVGLPLWYAHQVDLNTWTTIKACLMGVVSLPIVIPWRYVFATYVKARGDRWRSEETAARAEAQSRIEATAA